MLELKNEKQGGINRLRLPPCGWGLYYKGLTYDLLVLRISCRQLLELTCQIANALKTEGVKKGDRVAIYMPVSPQLAASMLACARIGAVHR